MATASHRFKDKVVIITGGAKGIGKGIADVFAEEDGRVCICDVDEDAGRLAEAQWEGKRNVVFMKCDVTVEEEIKQVVKETIERFGRIDCLINNAGVHPPAQTIDEVSSDFFQNIFNINVRSCFLFSKYVLPEIRKNGGNIINIASFVGTFGQPHAVPYAMTKGAVIAMTKAMAIDEAANNVRVNSISPSNVWTNMWRSLSKDKEVIKQSASCQLNGRFATLMEVGKLAFFIATDATYCTGQDFLISGGAQLSLGVKNMVPPQLPADIEE